MFRIIIDWVSAPFYTQTEEHKQLMAYAKDAYYGDDDALERLYFHVGVMLQEKDLEESTGC